MAVAFQWKEIHCSCGSDDSLKGCPQGKLDGQCSIWIREYPEDPEITRARQNVARREAINSARINLAKQLGIQPQRVEVSIKPD